jgi:hypothetical protein
MAEQKQNEVTAPAEDASLQSETSKENNFPTENKRTSIDVKEMVKDEDWDEETWKEIQAKKGAFKEKAERYKAMMAAKSEERQAKAASSQKTGHY